jgi:penicillin-binding protein 2
MSEVPAIAIALIVENGGWGAKAAAPIARKLMDYYLIDRFKPNDQIANTPGTAAAATASALSVNAQESTPAVPAAQFFIPSTPTPPHPQ